MSSLNPARLTQAEWRVDKIIQVVRERHGDIRFTLKVASELAGVSEQHLGTIFRRVTGQSFREYLRAVRISSAQELLKSPLYSAKEIAGRVGYSEQSNFNRDFRMLMGITPVAYRTYCDRQGHSR